VAPGAGPCGEGPGSGQNRPRHLPSTLALRAAARHGYLNRWSGPTEWRRIVSAENCLFCKIVAGEIPSQKVHEDEHVFAFRDISPQAPTHILVIPRRHVASLTDADDGDEGLLGRLLLACRNAARADGLDEGGYRVVTNIGDNGGQAVHHLHFHVLGGRSMGWPPG